MNLTENKMKELFGILLLKRRKVLFMVSWFEKKK